MPLKVLTNRDIMDYANLISLNIDCLPKDYLPDILENQSGIIMNLNNYGQAGSHWVCCCRMDDSILYYDPFGIIHMPKECEKMILNSVPKTGIYVSNGQNQYMTSTLCGYYCLKICKSILNDGMNFKEAIKQFDDTPSLKNMDIADNLFLV